MDYPNYHNNRRSDDLDLTTTAMMSLSLSLSLSSMMILMRIERWCYRHSSFLAQFSNGGVDSKKRSTDAILYATVDYLYIYLLVKSTSIININVLWVGWSTQGSDLLPFLLLLKIFVIYYVLLKMFSFLQISHSPQNRTRNLYFSVTGLFRLSETSVSNTVEIIFLLVSQRTRGKSWPKKIAEYKSRLPSLSKQVY